MGKKLNETKLKANLKLTVQRLRLQKKKRGNLADNEKRIVADFLAKGADDEARVRVEGIIKEEATCEAYEVLELFCELLLSRISVMKLSKQCPAELQEAVCSLCYAAGRHQHLTELLTVRQVLAAAYGKEFVQKAVVNQGGCVNATVLKKLAIQTPSSAQVTKYLTSIANKYEVEWQAELEPDADGVFPEAPAAKTAKKSKSSVSNASFPTISTNDDAIPAAPPQFDEEEAFPTPPPEFGGAPVASKPKKAARPAQKQAKARPGAVAVFPDVGGGNDDEEDDFDDLTARFAALKK